jgi:hypothetical protein
MTFFPDERLGMLSPQKASPLPVGLETRKLIEAFDLVLFSNSYILELNNIFYLFLHTKIPLLSSKRDEKTPLFFLGGSSA